MSQIVLATDKKTIKRNFNRAGAHYDQYAFIQREICHRLLENCQWMKCQPTTLIDCGTSTGYTANQLAVIYPQAHITGVDIAENMLKHAAPHPRINYCCADAERLPFADDSIDCVVSNLMLQWCNREKLFPEIQRILKPEGLFLFSTMGPDSLKELRLSWQAVDEQAHTHDFVDMHDLGDAMVQAKLAEPVMEMDKITFHYPDLQTLLADIKGIGAQNMHPQQNTSLMGKQRWQQFVNVFHQQFVTDGHYPLTYEVIYGHAWKVATGNTVGVDQTGVARFPLSHLRRQPGQ